MFTFYQAWKLYCSRIFSLTGRSSRAEYWWMQMIFYIASFTIQMLLQFVWVLPIDYSSHVYTGEQEFQNELWLFLLATGTSLVFLILTFALTVRRLHDRDLNGWWILLNFIPIIGGLILFIICLLPGTPYLNRYGLNPYFNRMAHFDFYTNQYHKIFGAFGLHPEMPGYPQYPNSQPYGYYYQQQYQQYQQQQQQQYQQYQQYQQQQYQQQQQTYQQNSQYQPFGSQPGGTPGFQPGQSQGYGPYPTNYPQSGSAPGFEQGFDPGFAQSNQNFAFDSDPTKAQSEASYASKPGDYAFNVNQTEGAPTKPNHPLPHTAQQEDPRRK